MIFVVRGNPGIVEAKDDPGDLPPGMEAIKVGSATIIAPEGIEVKKIADIVQLESLEQYVARNFVDFKSRMRDLEVREEALSEELGDLKKQIETEKRNINQPSAPENQENLQEL